MKKTYKPKPAISAESIARLVDKGQDISSYFTNEGRMMPPVRTGESLGGGKAKSEYSANLAQTLSNYQRSTRELMKRVHREDLSSSLSFRALNTRFRLLITLMKLREGYSQIGTSLQESLMMSS
jgi:hypothetical protein